MRLEPSTVIYVSLLNTRREPFSNMKARQAAAMALDNKAVTKAITFGYARPANTTLPDALAKGDFDATPTWWFNETTDPDLAVRWALCGTCGSKSYETYYSNKDVNELTEAAARELDPEKRAEMYKKIERITTEEVSQIPLYYAPYANAYSKRLKGLRMTPALQWTLEETEIQN